jgi:hypothetical protein
MCLLDAKKQFQLPFHFFLMLHKTVFRLGLYK